MQVTEISLVQETSYYRSLSAYLVFNIYKALICEFMIPVLRRCRTNPIYVLSMLCADACENTETVFQ